MTEVFDSVREGRGQVALVIGGSWRWENDVVVRLSVLAVIRPY